MSKKKYPLYYTTNELKRRRTMTDGKGKSSFFFARGIKNCSLFFNFFGLKILCPPAALPLRRFVFKSISVVTTLLKTNNNFLGYVYFFYLLLLSYFFYYTAFFRADPTTATMLPPSPSSERGEFHMHTCWSGCNCGRGISQDP